MPKLFFSCDHPQHDPIITEARLHTEKMLCPMVSDFVLDPPPLVLGLTKPYSISNGSVSSHIESNLSRVVVSALHQLNMSQSKHLTVRVNFADWFSFCPKKFQRRSASVHNQYDQNYLLYNHNFMWGLNYGDFVGTPYPWNISPKNNEMQSSFTIYRSKF